MELREEQETWRVLVGTLQATSQHKLDLDEEKEVRREQVDTLQVIAHTIKQNEGNETRREQVVMLQAIAHKIERNERKEARGTGRHSRPSGNRT